MPAPPLPATTVAKRIARRGCLWVVGTRLGAIMLGRVRGAIRRGRIGLVLGIRLGEGQTGEIALRKSTGPIVAVASA